MDDSYKNVYQNIENYNHKLYEKAKRHPFHHNNNRIVYDPTLHLAQELMELAHNYNNSVSASINHDGLIIKLSLSPTQYQTVKRLSRRWR